MKNVLKQSGKALCYFLLFFGSQIIFTVILMFYHAFMLGIEMATNGTMPSDGVMTPEMANEISVLLMDRIMASSGPLVIFAGILTMLVLWLFFFIRKKKLTIEAEIVPFERRHWIPVIGMGLGITLFCNGALSLLPIPEEVLSSYAESSAGLFEQPLWVALLSNVIAAPVVEEVVFRGLMNTRLRKAMPTVVAVLITSVLFGVMHGHILWASYAALMGILFAIVAVKCKSTLASIIVHMIVNLVSTIFSYSGWIPGTLEYAIMCGAGAIFLVGSLVLLYQKKILEEK